MAQIGLLPRFYAPGIFFLAIIDTAYFLLQRYPLSCQIVEALHHIQHAQDSYRHALRVNQQMLEKKGQQRGFLPYLDKYFPHVVN